MRVGLSWWDKCPHKRAPLPLWYLCLHPLCPHPPVRTEGEKTPSTNTKTAFARTRPCWHPKVRLPSLQSCENKFLLFKPSSLRNFVKVALTGQVRYLAFVSFTVHITKGGHCRHTSKGLGKVWTSEGPETEVHLFCFLVHLSWLLNCPQQKSPSPAPLTQIYPPCHLHSWNLASTPSCR